MNYTLKNREVTDYLFGKDYNLLANCQKYQLMKFPGIFFLVTVSFIGCSNNNAAEEKTVSTTEQQPVVASNIATSQPSGEGLVGKWRLTWQTFDENGNKKLDEEERKKAFPNFYFYQFNADGSCLVQNLKGHYEIKEEGGKKKLSTYADIEGSTELIGVYTILSVNKDELLLLDAAADYTFWPFKREK